jgi:hypothetical protein
MRVRYAESIALGMFLAVCAPLSAGQVPESGPEIVKRARAVRIPDGRIVIDGKLDEADWEQAEPADGFVQQQPREGAPATTEHRSEVRFLYDSANLYAGAYLHEDQPERLVTNELKRDFSTPRDGDLYIIRLCAARFAVV